MSTTENQLGPDGLRHSLTYQPALDGVRALAVGLVLFYHAGIPGFHGGFLGVDVFFGLSGFLITTLLLKEFNDTTTIRPVHFWIRRFKRLMPALVAMVLASTILAAALYPTGYFPYLVKDALGAIFYVSNWHLVGSHATYFNSLTAPSILTHTWSLSIEEQFYWAWPLIIFALLRIRRTPLIVTAVAGSGAVLSMILMNLGYTGIGSTTRLYFGTDTHVEGLLLGAAAAGLVYVIRLKPVVATGDFNGLFHLMGIFGLLLTLAVTYKAFGNSEFMFKWGFIVVALAVAAMVSSLSLVPSSPLAKFFGWGPFAYVGRISYGLYLWHYPIFTVINHFHTGLTAWTLFALRMAVTIVVTLASYYVLELPIRRRTWTRPRLAALASAATIAVVSVTCSLVAQGVQTPMAYTLAKPTALHHPVTSVVIGDSQILTFGIVTDKQRVHANVSTVSLAQLGCGVIGATHPVMTGILFFQNPDCRIRRDGTWALQNKWSRTISDIKPNVVIVAAGRWETHDQKIGHGMFNITEPSFRQRIVRSLDMIYADSVAAHSTMMLVTSVCSYSGESPFGRYYVEDSTSRLAVYNHLIEHFAATHHLPVFDLNKLVCPSGKFSYSLHGVQVRSADGVHYSWPAGPLFGDAFWGAVHRVGAANQAQRGR